MKNYTKEEIKLGVKKIWDDVREAQGYDYNVPDSIDVEIMDNGRVLITMSSMYEAPSLSYYQLKGLAEFFETEHIMDFDKFSYTGCETCDYGSSYGFTLMIG